MQASFNESLRTYFLLMYQAPTSDMHNDTLNVTYCVTCSCLTALFMSEFIRRCSCFISDFSYATALSKRERLTLKSGGNNERAWD